MATVKMVLAGGQGLTAAITLEAAEELKLAEGVEVRVLVKATDVALATGSVSGLSIRNQIPGTIAGVELGAAMATVKIDVADGLTLTAAITADAAVDLGLAEGASVTALIKSTEVSIAVG